MRSLMFALAALSFASSAHAAATTCDALKSQIEAKIQGHGVKTFSLEIVDAAQVKDQKVVGSCEGGQKKIVYKKGS